MNITGQFPHPDDRCGEFFIYRDFFECSDSWKRSKVDNIPLQLETYAAIRQMCSEVLDPVSEVFGKVHLTYGFSSPALVSEVKKNPYPNITPSGDQHAGSERNSNGALICDRQGIAVDCYVAGISSLKVARWIVENTPFDRLYFYSAHRPFHVSVGPDNSQKVVWMDGYRGGRHQPRMVPKDKFLHGDLPLS
ncbi:hypothetical protein [Microbulbifer agarilyticus]